MIILLNNSYVSSNTLLEPEQIEQLNEFKTELTDANKNLRNCNNPKTDYVNNRQYLQLESVCKNIRLLIKNYIDTIRTQYYNTLSIKKPIFENINDLTQAIELFINDKCLAINTFGHVMFWDVPLIENMSSLFRERDMRGINSMLWDVQNVRDMYNTFAHAENVKRMDYTK